MSELLDMEALYRQEHRRWLREEAPRKSLRDWISESVPYWIVLVALVLYGLSAPHTAGVFDKLTPTWGWIAPIGVEFGLLYTSFRRHLAHVIKETVPWTLWALEVLLFATAMLVNGAGAFSSVVETVQLQNLSFSAIVEEFGHLPATSQVAIVMAVLSALIIPIGALVAGDGMASLALERRGTNDFREERWQEVEFTVLYRAVFVRYLQQGIGDREARHRATSEVKGYLGRGSMSGIRLLSAGNEQTGQGANSPNGQKVVGVKGQVREYLAANPETVQLSINQVLATLREAGVQVGRTTVAEVLQERKQGL